MIEDQVVVEAVNLEKLFPVMTGFFEGLFSIEAMKRFGRATKTYFKNIFAKGREKSIGDLTKEYFTTAFQKSEKHYVHAVDNISFKIRRGETLGLVGESGCGKSTTGMLLMNLLEATGGRIFFKVSDTVHLRTSNVIWLTGNQTMHLFKSFNHDTVILTRNQKRFLQVDHDIDSIQLTEEQLREIRGTEVDESRSSMRMLHLFYRIYYSIRRKRIALNEQQQQIIRAKSTVDLSSLYIKQMKQLRKEIQIIFQNPYESLSPRFSVLDIVAEPLRLLNIINSEAEIEEKVKEELESVGLIPAEDFIDRFPHELSGGQRQRVGVARAFILDPSFIVADEPVSMLDVSIRVGVLKIMRQLSLERGTAFLFITHDLALARVMCDRIAVMYLGRIVEQGPTEELIQNPIHPYAKALIAGVPKPDPDARRTEDLPIIGEVPSGIDVPKGCRFHPRCPFAIKKCKEIDPQLEEARENHLVACIRYKEINKK